MKIDPIQPRFLRYRSHYKAYVIAYLFVSFLILSFWFLRFTTEDPKSVIDIYRFELFISVFYFFAGTSFYFFWLRMRLRRSIQVFPEHLLLSNGKTRDEIPYKDIESVSIVCWSIFYVKMKNGMKHYFNSSIERADYIWEGIHHARPEIFKPGLFEEYRKRLVQYDHHQKRKEWFFRHKMIDLFNWVLLPVMFISLSYIIQTRSVIVHQEGVYFFRLFMYALLILLSTAFLYSMTLKKLVFDKRISSQMDSSENKIRNMEFEGMILHRSKILQLMTACFALGILVKLDLNLYSITKVKEDIASFKLQKGHTILIDNRYNCVSCKYQLQDGDFIVFGKGTIGQILAKEGDMVGQIAQDKGGRIIASENVQKVPQGFMAVKVANGNDIVFVQIKELIGKIQN